MNRAEGGEMPCLRVLECSDDVVLRKKRRTAQSEWDAVMPNAAANIDIKKAPMSS